MGGYQQLGQPERWSRADLAIFAGIWTYSSCRVLLNQDGYPKALINLSWREFRIEWNCDGAA